MKYQASVQQQQTIHDVQQQIHYIHVEGPSRQCTHNSQRSMFNVKTSNLEVRDKVLLKQRKRNKFTTKFQLEPYTVIERKGTQIVAENERHTITRNASFFKKIKEGMRESDEDEVFNHRATMTELNNGTQALINNQVEEPGIRRSSRNRIQREQYRNPINPHLVIR